MRLYSHSSNYSKSIHTVSSYAAITMMPGSTNGMALTFKAHPISMALWMFGDNCDGQLPFAVSNWLNKRMSHMKILTHTTSIVDSSLASRYKRLQTLPKCGAHEAFWKARTTGASQSYLVTISSPSHCYNSIKSVSTRAHIKAAY